jgi:hypothetical protein
MRWDLFVIILVVYNCISIPFEVSFGAKFSDHVVMTVMDYCIDTCFGLDILITFFTTYVNSKTGSEVTNNKKIAVKYVMGRFWVDLAASVPFELLFAPFFSSDSPLLSVFGLFKLVRLLRLGRIITFLSFHQGFKVGAKIGQLIFFLLLLVHWVGCLWYMLVSDRDSWLPPKDLDAGETTFYDANTFGKYIVVFYYAILLLVGNEAAPTTTIQTLFASMIVIMGAIVTAFIFGNIAALVAQMG